MELTPNGSEATLQNKSIALYIVKKATAMFEDVSVEYTEEIIKVSFKNPANEEAVSVSFTLDGDDRIKLIANEGDHTFFDIEEEDHTLFDDILQEDGTTLNTCIQYFLNQRPESFSVNPTRSLLRNRVINVNDIQEGEDDSGFFRTDKNLIEATFGVYQDELFIDENEEVETPSEEVLVENPQINPSLDVQTPPDVQTPQTRQINTELGLGSAAIQQIYDHFKLLETEDQTLFRRLDRTSEEGGDNVDAQSMLEIRFENSKKWLVISSPQDLVNLIIVIYTENPANTFLRNSVNNPETVELAIDYIATEISIANGNLGDLEDKDVNAKSSQEIDQLEGNNPADQIQNDAPDHIDQIQEVFSEEFQEGKVLGLGDVPTKPMVMEVHSVPVSSDQSSGISLGKRAVFQFETVGTGADIKLIVSEVIFINKKLLTEVRLKVWSKTDQTSPGQKILNFLEIKTQWDAFVRTSSSRSPIEVPPLEEGLIIQNDDMTHIDQIQEIFSEEVLAGKVVGLGDYPNDNMVMQINSDSDLKLRFYFEVIGQDLMVKKVNSITLGGPNLSEVELKIWSKDDSNPINFQEIKASWDLSLLNREYVELNVPPVLEPESEVLIIYTTPTVVQPQPAVKQPIPASPEMENHGSSMGGGPVFPSTMPANTSPVIERDNPDPVVDVEESLSETADRLAGTVNPNWDQFTLSEEIKSQFRRSSGWIVRETMIGSGKNNPKLRIEKNGYYFEIELWQTKIKYKFMKNRWLLRDQKIAGSIFTYDNADWLFDAMNEQLTRAV